MSISNLNNVHLTDEQVTAVNQALTALEKALDMLKVNLTSDDRNKYGRVNEQNKLFINKVNEYALSQPQLRSIDVEWDEFFRDFKSRGTYEIAINRLESLLGRLKNAKILHDYDNYNDALNDYAYTGFRAGSNAVGFEQKHRELKQFFSSRGRRNSPTIENQPKNDQ
ncbi:hypothetical protein ACIRNY_03635 [Capnocytophaga canimorsus]|uniref:hypothetical protein n=1 Tax=Capnocytophaga canimorsus TaxID=28188 RepID=UPI00384B97D2